MTLLQLKQYVGRNVDDKSYTYFTETDIVARLNLAQKECQKRLLLANRDWYSVCVTTSTVANQKVYALPSDFSEIISLERILQGTGDLARGQKLEAITPNQKYGAVDVSGAPAVYYMQKNSIVLLPTPNAVYEMHLQYSYLVADMVLNTDEPDVPEQFHEYIGVLATRDCLFQDERSIAPIQYKLDHYEQLFKQMNEQRQVDSAQMIVTVDDIGMGGW